MNKDINVRWRNPESIISEIQDILMFSPNVQSIRVLDDLFLRDFNSVNNAISIFSEFPNMHWRGMAHDYDGSIYYIPCKYLFIDALNYLPAYNYFTIRR